MTSKEKKVIQWCPMCKKYNAVKPSKDQLIMLNRYGGDSLVVPVICEYCEGGDLYRISDLTSVHFPI